MSIVWTYLSSSHHIFAFCIIFVWALAETSTIEKSCNDSRNLIICKVLIEVKSLSESFAISRLQIVIIFFFIHTLGLNKTVIIWIIAEDHDKLTFAFVERSAIAQVHEARDSNPTQLCKLYHYISRFLSECQLAFCRITQVFYCFLVKNLRKAKLYCQENNCYNVYKENEAHYILTDRARFDFSLTILQHFVCQTL